MLEDWDARSDNTGKQTKETYLALHHTNALLEITKGCLSELSANYVLFGYISNRQFRSSIRTVQTTCRWTILFTSNL